VLLFERVVLWAARTDHIFNNPAVATSQEPACCTAGAAGHGPPRQRVFYVESNFCQEPTPQPSYNDSDMTEET
jgi:hypothetical protein